MLRRSSLICISAVKSADLNDKEVTWINAKLYLVFQYFNHEFLQYTHLRRGFQSDASGTISVSCLLNQTIKIIYSSKF